jgi:hypothetical protein
MLPFSPEKSLEEVEIYFILHTEHNIHLLKDEVLNAV